MACADSRFMSEKDTRALIVAALESVAPAAVQAAAPDDSTRLIGEGAVIDSVALIGLLVEIERALDGQIDLSQAFMDHGSMEGDDNPFDTVGSLAEFISGLLVR